MIHFESVWDMDPHQAIDYAMSAKGLEFAVVPDANANAVRMTFAESFAASVTAGEFPVKVPVPSLATEMMRRAFLPCQLAGIVIIIETLNQIIWRRKAGVRFSE